MIALGTGCSGPPSQEGLTAALISEAALPRDCEIGLIRIYREDVGHFQPDHGDLYQVTIDEPCRAAWQSGLASSDDWECHSDAATCVRNSRGAAGNKAVRYREEWGTIRFLSARLAQVELQKI